MSDSSIPFVQRIRRSDGRLDLYFRRGDVRRPLKATDDTEALREEVDAILAELAAVQRAKAPRPGTVGGCLKAFNRSADFLALARSTQSEYQRVIDEMVDDAGTVLLADVTSAWVRDMRDAWAIRGHRVANVRLSVLADALEDALEDGRITADPFARLRRAKRPHVTGEAHPAWEDSEVAAFIALAKARKMPGLARAIALGRWGGFRRGTICAIPLAARIAGHDDQGRPQRRLYWLTEKRKVVCDKPEDARLTALLADTPSRALTIAYNRNGDPWRPRQLNQAMDRLIEALSDPKAEGGPLLRPNLTLHGLRHARGVELALAGASDAEIMSQLEHATDRAAKIYRRQADRRKLADAAQGKVDNVVRLKARRAARAANH